MTISYKLAPTAGSKVSKPEESAHISWMRSVVDVLNNAMKGKVNVTVPITLATSVTTTALVDARIGPSSAILLMPTTLDAAGAHATTYVSQVTGGSATITHANNAQVDRTFTAVIIG